MKYMQIAVRYFVSNNFCTLKALVDIKQITIIGEQNINKHSGHYKYTEGQILNITMSHVNLLFWSTIRVFRLHIYALIY